MKSYWNSVGPHTNMTGVLIKREKTGCKDTWRKDDVSSHRKTDIHKLRRESWNRPSLSASEGINLTDTLILDLQPPMDSSTKLIPQPIQQKNSPYTKLPLPSQSKHTLTNT